METASPRRIAGSLYRRAFKRVKDHADERDRLYQQIGKLQYELDWLKKKNGVSD